MNIYLPILAHDSKAESGRPAVRQRGWNMNSYVNLILDSEAARKRLLSRFEIERETDRQSRVRSPADQQRFNRSLQPRFGRVTLSPEVTGHCARGSRLAAQGGSLTIETSVWITSFLFAVLGLMRAAYSETPSVWLAVWPAPIALFSTIFVFLRQGFHYRDGLFVLGRRSK